MNNILFKTTVVFSIVLLCVSTVKAQYALGIIERTVVHNARVLEKSKAVTPSLRMFEFGIRYMPTFSSLDLRTYSGDVVKGSVTMQHGFGAMFGINMSNHVGIQGELNYYQVAQSYADAAVNREVKISYVNIPVLLSINTNKTSRVNLNLVAGPQFGVNAGSSIKTTGTENSGSLRAVIALKKGDVGFAYGAGLEIALNEAHTSRLDFGYRGFYGLVDINATNTDANSYNVIVKASRKTNGLYIGLAFLF